ncbi:MAG: toprim domain-containing protein [Bryobacteraceae bacterium]|nr:toprim domain-containing protein [Bryobacteraceae bacterium]
MKVLDFNPSEVASYYRSRFPALKQSGPEWRGPCPIHQGADDNFAVNPENGLAFCHSQCGRGWNILQLEQQISGRAWKECRDAVHALLGRPARGPAKLTEVAAYDYTDAKGEFLFQVVRYEPKTFRQRRRVVKMDGASAAVSWEYNIKGIARVLYRLPKVLAADQVLLVEGEKDVENLERLGFVATCNPGGACNHAGKWLKNYTETLEGKNVVLLPDNDTPGEKHAGIVVEALRHRVKELRRLTIPTGKDASDWIAAGATRATIEDAIAQAPIVGGNSGSAPPNGEGPPTGHPSTPPSLAGPALPQIQVNDRPFRSVCQNALSALTASNSPPHLFVRACRIAAIETTELGRPFIADLDETKLRNALAQTADYFELSARGVRKEVPPPIDVSRNIRTLNPALWGFPVLEGVVEAPTLRTDGTILATAGYDPASRLYLVPSPGLDNFEVPDTPTRDHIDVALESIRDILAEFPFVDQASYANAIGALVTSVCRHIISGPVPLALFDATTQGTGKTLLAELIALILTGRAAELVTPLTEAEELRKQLTSILIEAPSLVIIDNVTSTVDWGVLAKVITGEIHRDRILGKSQTVSVPIRCSWIATGNNLQLGGDMARRCFWVRMDAGVPDPFRRTGFKHERIKDYVLEHRRGLLLALLTIARAWFAAGQPRASTPPVGSFERWTEVVAGILEYAGVEGFLGNGEKLFTQSDTESSEWESFLDEVEETFQATPFTVSQLWERLNEKTYEEIIRQSVLSDRAEQLREALPADLTSWMEREGPFKQRLGLAFNQRRGRKYGPRGLRIERAPADTHRKVNRWKVVSDA